MLEGAVKAGDRLAESYRSLGIAYLKSQEYDKAKEAFKSSLSSMKHKDAEFSRDVMYYEAETCVQAGDLDGAIEICTNIQEEKADADALFLRGRAYFLQKNYEQAKRILMRQWRRRRAISSALTFTSCIRRAA